METKLKGAKYVPMPKYWYSRFACDNDFDRSICADKKPYFFTYIYDNVKSKYRDFTVKANNSCMYQFGIDIQTLQSLKTHTEEQLEFLKWFDIKNPIGNNPCAMNRICWHVEKEMDGYKNQVKRDSEFDYTLLKVKRRCTNENRLALEKTMKEYIEMIREYKATKRVNDLIDKSTNREFIKNKFREIAKEVCKNDDERLNIVLDLCYGGKGNKQFCWDVIGDLIIKRLEELNDVCFE